MSNFQKKKGYEIVQGGIEYTRPPYSKIDKFLGRAFAFVLFALVFYAISTFIMLAIYKIGGY